MKTILTVVMMLLISKSLLANEVIVSVSVDWEGLFLKEENIKAMEEFNQRNPDIPLIQFLNAAYYTKPGVDHEQITKSTKRALKANDEVGIHIHGWKSLYEAAGVGYISEPPLVASRANSKCDPDCGHVVPISVYNKDETVKVLEYSKKMILGQGLTQQTPISFRAGAWMADSHIRAALIQSGFLFDSSSVPYTFVAGRFPGELVVDEVHRIWPYSYRYSQPYKLTESNGWLYEMPDNGCLADYITTEGMFEVYHANVLRMVQNKEQATFVHVGFHQESAAKFVKNVERAVHMMREDALEKGLNLRFMTFRSLLKDPIFLRQVHRCSENIWFKSCLR